MDQLRKERKKKGKTAERKKEQGKERKIFSRREHTQQ